MHETHSVDVATDKCGSARANSGDLLCQMAALIKKKKYKIRTNYMQRQKY